MATAEFRQYRKKNLSQGEVLVYKGLTLRKSHKDTDETDLSAVEQFQPALEEEDDAEVIKTGSGGGWLKKMTTRKGTRNNSRSPPHPLNGGGVGGILERRFADNVASERFLSSDTDGSDGEDDAVNGRVKLFAKA